jgi:hypothetical protein
MMNLVGVEGTVFACLRYVIQALLVRTDENQRKPASEYLDFTLRNQISSFLNMKQVFEL